MAEVIRVLVTGANGFVGWRLLLNLVKKPKLAVTALVRNIKDNDDLGGRVISTGDLDGQSDWRSVLAGHDVIIHTAARAHIMKDEISDPLSEYRRVNTEGTLNLARQAVDAGVKRFIFISSVKVNGEQTVSGRPFTASDTPQPEDPYGVSKWEAEEGLKKLAQETGMEVVIIRPPLVYGPGVKGNFASMIRLVGKGLPLPLGAIRNKRSLVALDNLVDLVITCIDHPAAANQTFLAADGEDLSTTELLEGVAQAMGRPSRLIPVPAGVLEFGASLLGKKAVAQRLLGSLQVDIKATRDTLGWEPPLTVQQGLARCFETQQD